MPTTRRLVRAWVTPPLLEEMHAGAEEHVPNETGGMLVGYWAAGDVVITSVTQAGPRATHQRDRYEPDASHDLRLIAELYRESGRHWTYLGDWHSHTLKGDRLSDLDRTTLRTIADATSARLARPVMVIVTVGTDPSTAIWVFDRRSNAGSCHVRRATIRRVMQ
jgi:integrative and conjugative element protein (TIGR02256 family)